MNVATLKTGKYDALRQFAKYREAVRERHTEEDARIMATYKALAAGKRVLNLFDVIRAAGLQPATGLPALAVCRAGVGEWCYWFPWWRTFSTRFHFDRRTRRHEIALPDHCLPAASRQTERRYRAVVPTIPPWLRPAGDLTKYHVLWDAVWERAAPVDPILLREIASPMYAVVAQWDLSEVERSVLGARAME